MLWEVALQNHLHGRLLDRWSDQPVGAARTAWSRGGVNVVAAVLILVCLHLGKDALRQKALRQAG